MLYDGVFMLFLHTHIAKKLVIDQEIVKSSSTDVSTNYL